jgi:hypothetical protein
MLYTVYEDSLNKFLEKIGMKTGDNGIYIGIDSIKSYGKEILVSKDSIGDEYKRVSIYQTQYINFVGVNVKIIIDYDIKDYDSVNKMLVYKEFNIVDDE